MAIELGAIANLRSFFRYHLVTTEDAMRRQAKLDEYQRLVDDSGPEKMFELIQRFAGEVRDVEALLVPDRRDIEDAAIAAAAAAHAMFRYLQHVNK